MSWEDSDEYWAMVDRYANAWDFYDPTSYRVPSVLLGASPDAGKSTLMVARYWLPALEAGTVVQHFNDPARSGGILAAGHSLWRGQDDRLLIDDLADPQFGLGVVLLGISRSTDWETRKSENALHQARFVANLRRMANDEASALVTLYEWGTFAAQLVQFQEVKQDQRMVFFALKPGTDEWTKLYRGCVYRQVRDKADEIAKMYRRSPTEFVKNTQATQRRLDRLENSPNVMNRLWDSSELLQETVEKCGQIIILGAKNSAIDPQVQTFIMGSWHIAHIADSSARWVKNNHPTQRQMLCDETWRNGLALRIETDSIAEQRKEGVNWLLAGTRPDTGDEILDGEQWHSTNEHIAMRCQGYEDARRWVHDMLSVDSTKVKEVRSTIKMLHDGYDEFDSVSRRIDSEGGLDGRSISKAHRPRYREVEETQNVYEATGDQIYDAIMQLRQFDRGVYVRSFYGKISDPQYQVMPEDVWDGDSVNQVMGHIRSLKEKGILRKAIDYSSSEIVSPTAAPRREPPPPAPAAPAKRNGRGPNGSGGRQSTSTSKNSR